MELTALVMTAIATCISAVLAMRRTYKESVEVLPIFNIRSVEATNNGVSKVDIELKEEAKHAFLKKLKA